MRSPRLAAALAGAGFGFSAAALAHALATCFWPLAAAVVLRGAVVAGGIGALATGFASDAWRGRLRCRLGLLALLAAGAAVTAMATVGAPARLGADAGRAPGLPPLLHLAALVVPFIVAGIALGAWCERDGRQRRMWFLAGIGAGYLGASLVTGIQGEEFPPWRGGRRFEVASGEVSIDRGLRSVSTVPDPADLAFPLPARTRAEVLMVGLGDGSVVARLVRQPQVHVTVLEADAELLGTLLERWPAVARARTDGRLTVVAGAERWALAGLGRAFDLVVVSENWSAPAYRARALSHRRDYRWTVEAFTAYLSRLKPEGRLLVHRNGIARVLLALRVAARVPAAEFGRRVVVLGRGGGVVSECWYSGVGFESREARGALGRHRQRPGVRILYTPDDAPPGRNFYLPLVRGERVPGLAFSTPLDLSPTIDERPFFDHAERAMLTLRLQGMPEEFESLADPRGVRIFLAADRPFWGTLCVGALLCAAVPLVGRRRMARARADAAPFAAVRVDALWSGAAAGLVIESFAAWAEWVTPAPVAARVAVAALIVGFGIGWGGARRGTARRTGWAPAAAMALLLGAGGYRVLPAAVRFGAAPVASAVVVVGLLLGAALGRALEAAAREEGVPQEGTEAVNCAVGLAVAALAAVAATLAAPHFGYPLLWILGSVGLLVPWLRAWRGARRGADPAT